MPPASKPSPQSLPSNSYPPGDLHTAYKHCLRLESHTGWNFTQDASSEVLMHGMTPAVTARILGYGLCLAPNDAGRNALVRDIIACGEDPELLAGLGYLYAFGLIRVFFNPKGPTPAVTPSLTPTLSLEAAAQNPHLVKPSSSNASDLRKLTLLRDNYRCVFTGGIDKESVQQAADVDPSAPLATTNVAHIISQSLSDNITGTTPAVHAKFDWTKTAGAILERFGGFAAHAVLGGDNLHSPKNAFTSSFEPHSEFDNLDLWLTPAKDAQGQVIPDTYDVNHCYGLEYLRRLVYHVKPQIVFRSLPLGDQVIPAPDPDIIALHAACARIAHMSGAAEYLRELYRDVDNIAVMTEPNAAYELSRALKTLQVATATVPADSDQQQS
ncbi:hypothetical protein EWM64_g2485 [Hericium alpestre]|uniref:HNH nuclease domain-containing protein n=1 Tax=Hericium alpestre TaxID=135208 RepID=A0A4Z0A5B7_9AGAM|nr:hypothetical protein EWM64_g2485 [Hericium alpestre]